MFFFFYLAFVQTLKKRERGTFRGITGSILSVLRAQCVDTLVRIVFDLILNVLNCSRYRSVLSFLFSTFNCFLSKLPFPENRCPSMFLHWGNICAIDPLTIILLVMVSHGLDVLSLCLFVKNCLNRFLIILFNWHRNKPVGKLIKVH